MILFLVIMLMMLLLFMIMFVVVVFLSFMVTIGCVESIWLCVMYAGWPNGGGVMMLFCVDHVVIDAVIVDICGCCDCMIHGGVVVSLIVMWPVALGIFVVVLVVLL